VVVALLLAIFRGFGALPSLAQTGTVDDWSMYLYDNQRDGFNGNDAIAHQPTQQGSSRPATGGISTQLLVFTPTGMDPLVYWAAADGHEYATDTVTGSQVWAANLGTVPGCGQFTSAGVGDTGVIASVPGLGSGQALFIGGNNPNVSPTQSTPMLYALDPASGKLLWPQATPLSPSTNAFVWSSPVYYNGSIYVGLSSINDCPLVQGQVIQVNALTGVIQNTFDIVPTGCIGGGVWGSPTLANGVVYVATGNAGSCLINPPPSNWYQYTDSVIALNASNLTYISSWRAPNPLSSDLDFGSTPTLFQQNIGGQTESMVGVANKNGYFYAFNRAQPLSNGYVWEYQLAISGADPTQGDGSIAPAAYDSTATSLGQLGTLYLAGGIPPTSAPSDACYNHPNSQGSLQAFDMNVSISTSNPLLPSAFRWAVCFDNSGNPSGSGDKHVLGAVTAMQNEVVVGEGIWIVVADKSSGTPYYTQDPVPDGIFVGAASVANDELWIGDVPQSGRNPQDRYLYAFK
jgi:hypothetical protein